MSARKRAQEKVVEVQQAAADSPTLQSAKQTAKETADTAIAKVNETAAAAKAKVEAGDWPEFVLVAERAVNWFVELLQGKIGSNSHPLHPILIHLPFAFLISSLAIDTFHLFGPMLPTFVRDAIYFFTGEPEKVATLNRLSYNLAGAGLLTSLPATATGLAELHGMVRAKVMEVGWKKLYQGIRNGEEKKIIATLRHAGSIDLALILVSYTFLERRYHIEHINSWYVPNTYHVTDAQLALSTMALMSLCYAGYKGGDLVYAKGVGVQRQGAAASSS